MTKLPDLAGNRVVKALQKDGWAVKSRKGSHEKLAKPGRNHFLIVPVHGSATIPRGTLSNIVKDAGLSVGGFIDLI